MTGAKVIKGATILRYCLVPNSDCRTGPRLFVTFTSCQGSRDEVRQEEKEAGSIDVKYLDQIQDLNVERSKVGAKERWQGDDDDIWHCLASCNDGERSRVKEAYRRALERVHDSLLKRTGGRLGLPPELFAIVDVYTSPIDEDLIDHFELVSFVMRPPPLRAVRVELSYEAKRSRWLSEPLPTRFDSHGQHRAWLARNKPRYVWKAMRVLDDAQPQEAVVAPVTVSGLCEAGLVRLKYFPALGANVHYYVPSRTAFLLSHDATALFLCFSLLDMRWAQDSTLSTLYPGEGDADPPFNAPLPFVICAGGWHEVRRYLFRRAFLGLDPRLFGALDLWKHAYYRWQNRPYEYSLAWGAGACGAKPVVVRVGMVSSSPNPPLHADQPTLLHHCYGAGLPSPVYASSVSPQDALEGLRSHNKYAKAVLVLCDRQNAVPGCAQRRGTEEWVHRQLPPEGGLCGEAEAMNQKGGLLYLRPGRRPFHCFGSPVTKLDFNSFYPRLMAKYAHCPLTDMIGWLLKAKLKAHDEDDAVVRAAAKELLVQLFGVSYHLWPFLYHYALFESRRVMRALIYEVLGGPASLLHACKDGVIVEGRHSADETERRLRESFPASDGLPLEHRGEYTGYLFVNINAYALFGEGGTLECKGLLGRRDRCRALSGLLEKCLRFIAAQFSDNAQSPVFPCTDFVRDDFRELMARGLARDWTFHKPAPLGAGGGAVHPVQLSLSARPPRCLFGAGGALLSIALEDDEDEVGKDKEMAPRVDYARYISQFLGDLRRIDAGGLVHTRLTEWDAPSQPALLPLAGLRYVLPGGSD